MYIDSHCHIYYDTFNDDILDVINRAQDAGVKKMICIGVDLKSSESCIELAQKFENVYATVGFHPHETGGRGLIGKAMVQMRGQHEHPLRIRSQLGHALDHPFRRGVEIIGRSQKKDRGRNVRPMRLSGNTFAIKDRTILLGHSPGAPRQTPQVIVEIAAPSYGRRGRLDPRIDA